MGKVQITEQDFYIVKPRAMGWQGWSLLVPAVASSVGFFCFGVLAFSFTELEALPVAFRTGLTLTGAFTLAFGSECGTLASVTEIYRKGALGAWDKFALGVSMLATFGAFTLAFASLLGVKATWGAAVQMYGPVVLGLLAALDSYGGFMEFGLYLNGFDKRMSSWQRDFEDFKRQTLAAQAAERQAARQTLAAQAAASVSNTVEVDTAGGGDVSTIDKARAVKAARDLSTKRGRIDKMLSIFEGDPEAAITDVAEAIGVTRQTVYSYLSELEGAGVIHNNGGGVKVL